MAREPKTWKSVDEQLAILQERGLEVGDEAEAKRILSRVGYYRLSGYWYPFRQFGADGKRLDAFMDGSRFEDVAALYLFDRRLRLLALDALERIELAVQVEVGRVLGQRDPFAHENQDQLHGNFTRKRHPGEQSRHEKWLVGYRSLVSRARRKTFVRHHLDHYGRLSIWVAIEVFDFGTLSKLYSGMQIKDKVEIEKQFGLNDGKHLQTWLRSLNFIRNTAAHHSRLWNCNVLERSSVPRNKIELGRLINSRPFLYFCIMQTMLRVISPNSTWGQRFTNLLDHFPAIENKAVQLSDMGVTPNWKRGAIWR